jgi:hypothetical protein
MGHDIPPQLVDQLTALIADHAVASIRSGGQPCPRD